jgi:hypothetical protein
MRDEGHVSLTAGARNGVTSYEFEQLLREAINGLLPSESR